MFDIIFLFVETPSKDFDVHLKLYQTNIYRVFHKNKYHILHPYFKYVRYWTYFGQLNKLL